MAPENSASIAEGPALKLFQSIFTLEPSAFSNHPLALPTMACGCVIFGNAPTRMTVPCPQPEIEKLRMKTNMMRTLFISSPELPSAICHSRLPFSCVSFSPSMLLYVARRQYRPTKCARGCGQPRRERRGTRGKERDAPRRDRSNCEVARHLQ